MVVVSWCLLWATPVVALSPGERSRSELLDIESPNAGRRSHPGLDPWNSCPMAAIERLDFLGVPTQDPERSRAFYRDVLGLRPDEHAEWEQWAGDTCFGIWEPERQGMPFVAQKGNPWPLRCDDVAENARGARGQGRPVLRRHVRHRRLPHGDLRRPRRQGTHAAPPVRAVRVGPPPRAAAGVPLHDTRKRDMSRRRLAAL